MFNKLSLDSQNIILSFCDNETINIVYTKFKVPLKYYHINDTISPFKYPIKYDNIEIINYICDHIKNIDLYNYSDWLLELIDYELNNQKKKGCVKKFMSLFKKLNVLSSVERLEDGYFIDAFYNYDLPNKINGYKYLENLYRKHIK